METSKDMQGYFENLDEEVKKAYSIANKARLKGYDPDKRVEIILAKNMAERVEGLISVVAPQIVKRGIPERIIELEKQYGSQDWRVAFIVALEVAQKKFCDFEDEREAMEVGLRIGLAYLTNGVVASPLEGFTRLVLKKRRDGNPYFSLYFSGPIRSAGTTANCAFVALADYVRQKMGYKEYDPSEQEIKRMVTEVTDFHERITNLQYFPSEEEVDFMIRNLPVQIDGDPSEKIEVSNYKNLDRIESDRIRNGVALVIGEGLTQKSAKFYGKFERWKKDFGIESMDFLEDFVKLQKSIKAKEKKKEESGDRIKPDYTYIKDIVAGRPVLTHPLCKGGFRLRYGRGRTSGLSSTSIHPATMVVLENYIANCTQLKVERPGKSTVLSVNDSLEGPIVKLNNENVLFLESEEQAKKYVKDVKEILFLGDILVSYGDFLNRAHVLVPPGYCEEWWIRELEKKANESLVSEEVGLDLPLSKKLFQYPLTTKISFDHAYNISKQFRVPLHPRFTFHWKDINHKEFLVLVDWLNKAIIKRDESKIILPLSYKLEDANINPKRVLELLGVPHIVVSRENVLIDKDWAKALMASLGFFNEGLDVKEIVKSVSERKDVLEIVNSLSEIILRDKSGISIGARMGRPEKAKIRKLTGSPHVLFPVGEEGGRLRCFQSAMDLGKVNADFPDRYCNDCKIDTIYPVCENCGKETSLRESKTNFGDLTYKKKDIDIRYYLEKAKNHLGIKQIPDLVKGVRGTSNEEHIPENLAKGLLRATRELFVNKDGTIRYDMTEMAVTHFKPAEIGTSVKKLRELGYVKDIYGEELVHEGQVLEIKPQDVILPACRDSDQEGADVVLFRVSKFIDDILERFYKMEKFYNLKNKEDIVGHLVIALAPHISAGIVGRIIGFSRTQGCYAHPYWHCAQRRDCDGDENCVFLLMDGLLNFSRKYLPSHRGGVQDSPLILTSNLISTEVDDMIFDMDCVWRYPLDFYEACQQYKMPWEVDMEKVGDRLGTEKQYEKFGFTHDVSNMNHGVRCSAYKFLPTMQEKVLGQMDLAERIRAVNESDVAKLVIERHFIRDIRGNLRKFSMQQFRCVKCNDKYRRPPLLGKCLRCGGKLIFTISEGSIAKYLRPSIEISDKYELPDYTKQVLDLVKMHIESVFGKEDDRQQSLGNWFK